MRHTLVIAGLLLPTALALASCDAVERSCTAELRTAVLVRVTSPLGLPIDAVTAERSAEADCEGNLHEAQDGGQGPFEFWCWEQGGGTYVVRVTSGALIWTQSARVQADECHTTSPATLTFVLDPDTAD